MMQSLSQWVESYAAWPSASASPPLYLAIDIVAKATILMLFAMLAVAYLSRASAAVRHRIWGLLFCGLLALPLLSAALPQWRIPILPSVQPPPIAASSDPSQSIDVMALRNGASVRTLNEGQTLVSPPNSLSGPLPSEPGLSMPASRPGRIEEGTPSASQVPARFSPATTSSPLSATRIGLLIWAAGAALVLLPLVLSQVCNAVLRLQSKRVEGSDWNTLLVDLKNSLRLTRRVDLLSSERPLVPMTCGVLRPVVMLPGAAATWSDQLRRFVLLHELAHVKRWDVAFQMVARATCSLYWFHPLAWICLRRLRIERELACDDCVLAVGERPAEYAQQLLEIARSFRPTGLVAGVAMAQTTSLEARIRSMLDRARSHVPLTPRFAAGLLVVSLAVITGVAVVQPAAREAAAQTNTTVPTDETRKNGDEDVSFEYAGKVVTPAGEPIRGAKVFMVYWIASGAPIDPVGARAKTDSEGNFSFQVRQSEFEPNTGPFFQMCAIAPGYGFAAAPSVFFEATGLTRDMMPDVQRQHFEEQYPNPQPILRLAPDRALQGRIVDLDGGPVANARVRVDRVWFNDTGSLDEWERAARGDRADFYSLRSHTPRIVNGPQLETVLGEVRSDREGKFKLVGVGSERVVQLIVSGPGIETSLVKARTRNGDEISIPHEWRRRGQVGATTELYYPADFTLAAGPSTAVTGQVTDVDSGQPIQGAIIRAGHIGMFTGSGLAHVATMTDDEGRYSLSGLPMGNAHSLYLYPPSDSAYLPSGVSMRLQPGQRSASRDFELKRGVVVRGRIVDDRTGQPVAGRVQYYALENNTNLESYKGFTRSAFSYERAANRDGEFEIPIPAGPGVVAFTALEHANYRRGSGAETVPRKDQDRDPRMLPTVPGRLISTSVHLLKYVDPKADAAALDLELAITSGLNIPGTLVNQQGQAIRGGVVSGAVHAGSWYPHPGQQFEVRGYYPDAPRDIFAYHLENDLAGYFRLEGDAPDVVKVPMQPAGTVRGRLIDEAGAPIPGVQLGGQGIPQDNSGNVALRMETAKDGRFEIKGLVPHRKYTVFAHSLRKTLFDVTLGAGEVKDVGDVTPQGPIVNRAATPRAALEQDRKRARELAESIVSVEGHVRLPNGMPAVGAIIRAKTPVYAMAKDYLGKEFDTQIHETKTDEKGNFTIAFSRRPYGVLGSLDSQWRDIWKRTTIAASMPGYGGQWIRYDQVKRGQVTLQLVEDLPIRGRVVDLEGNPLAGVTVNIAGPSATMDEDLSPWIDAAKNGELPWSIHTHTPRTATPQLIGVPSKVVTDGKGSFVIEGIGKERHFSITFQGERVAHEQSHVVTRGSAPFERVIANGSFKATETVYGTTFTFTATPARSIVGTVRDAKTGRPLAGVSVESFKFSNYPYSGHRVLKTVTDRDGKYRVDGMPKGDGNRLIAVPNDEQPYFMRYVDVPNPTGISPATVDIELHRGIWITGHVRDKVSGEPIEAARIHFLPYRTNTFAQELPEFDEHGNVEGDQMRYTSKADGSYRVVGLPGPSIIGGESVFKTYRRGAGYESIQGPLYRQTDNFDTYRNPVYPGPKWPHVMVEINPPAESESVTVDLLMDPGRDVALQLFDPKGQPLRGVSVRGLTSDHRARTADEAAITAKEFGDDETRTMIFHHPADKLGWVARVHPRQAEEGPVEIKLQSTAKLTARLVHADGSPMPGVVVDAWPLPSGDFAKRLPAVTSDADGRLEMTLLAGAAYYLRAEGADIMVASLSRMVTVEPGEEKHLGDLHLVDRSFVPVEQDQLTETPGRTTMIRLHGKVVDTDGNPKSGAAVWLRGPFVSDWTRLEYVFRGGEFEFAVDRTRLDAALRENPNAMIEVSATARGHRRQTVEVRAADAQEPIVIRLKREVPVSLRANR